MEKSYKMQQMLYLAYLPGQDCVLQGLLSIPDPVHSFPPYDSSWLLDRVRVSTPGPQVLEHEDHLDQVFHSQSTGHFFSSELSPQSFSPSHTQVDRIHALRLAHRNSVKEHETEMKEKGYMKGDYRLKHKRYDSSKLQIFVFVLFLTVEA